MVDLAVHSQINSQFSLGQISNSLQAGLKSFDVVCLIGQQAEPWVTDVAGIKQKTIVTRVQAEDLGGFVAGRISPAVPPRSKGIVTLTGGSGFCGHGVWNGHSTSELPYDQNTSQQEPGDTKGKVRSAHRWCCSGVESAGVESAGVESAGG